MIGEHLLKEVRETLWQYESDLLHPPEGDSRERRLERVRSVTAKLASADTHRNGGDAKQAPGDSLSGAVGSEADETPR